MLSQQEILFLIPYAASLLTSAGVALYCWSRREVAGTRAYTSVALSQVLWIGGYICELLSPEVGAKLQWDNVQWLAVFLIPFALFRFALDFTGQPVAGARWITILYATFAAAFMLMVYTDPLHGLLRPSYTLIPGSPFDELAYDFTAPVWVAALVVYGIHLFSISLLIRRLFRAHPVYRGQVGVIALGNLLPVIATFLPLVGIQLTFHRDTTPFAFALSNLLVAWGLFHYRLFDLVPVARNELIERMSDFVIVEDRHGRLVDANPAAQRVLSRPLAEMIGQPLAAAFPQRTDLIMQFQHTESTASEVAVDTPSGQAYFDLRITPLLERGERSGRLIVARDITDRKRIEEAEHEQRIFAEALVDAAQALNSTLDLDEVLARNRDNFEKVVPFTYGGIAFLREDIVYLDVRPGRGVTKRYPITFSQSPLSDVPILRQMLEVRQPVLFSNTSVLPDASRLREMPWIRSVVAAPIILPDGRVEGFLIAVSDQPDFYTNVHMKRMQAFAEQAAIAIENARLYQLSRQMAIYEERQRLAREVHDTVSQTVFAASTIAELIPRVIDTKPDTARAYAEELSRLMRAAMAEMRLLMIELRPDALRQTDLGLLLRHLSDSIMGDSAVEATITTTEKLILPEPVHIAFYRIAQQTLNNIVRHAHATAVTIDLEREDSHAVLRIRDNGRGFDPADVPSDRFGIKLMREQALGAGAELSITSQPGAGTELVLRGTVDDRQSDPHPSRG